MASTIEAEDASAIAQEAFAPIKFGEGPRIGVLGDSRCGKTEAQRRLIDEYMRRSPGPVLIADDKETKPQFRGQYFRDKRELESKRAQEHVPELGPYSRVIVLRGARFDREAGEVDPEEIAEVQWDLAQKNIPSLGVYDEAEKACAYGNFKKGSASTILWAFKRGGSSRVSSLWGSQETQDIPAAMFNQSSMILCFRMTGAPLRLLRERGYLEPKGSVELVIPTLPGDELPPEQRGYFVALRRGRPWDGKVWRFK